MENSDQTNTSRFNKTKVMSVVFVAFVIVLILKTFVVEGLVVSGESMSPMIASGDYIFINKLAYIWDNPKRGDIVVVKPRVNVGSVVKRIVGMPGERLQIINNIVTVKEGRNGTTTPLDELYLNGVTTNEIGTTYIQLDPFEYFVFGDDREVSVDSRELGPVDIYNIKGKPFLIFNTKNFSFRLIY